MTIKAIFIVLVIFVSCKSKVETPSKVDNTSIINSIVPSLPILVYKTKNDYSNLVPVFLNDDRTEIVSYPDPKDIKVGSKFFLPTSLQDGYLLDNKGIGKNVAFLKYTYEEYSKLKNLPTLEELYNNIIDKNPLIELCDCGNKSKYVDLEKQLNEYIGQGIIRIKCKILK